MQNSKKKLMLDIGTCNMCMSCVEVCPKVFKENASGYVEIFSTTTCPSRKINEAIKYCPQNCIYWT